MLEQDRVFLCGFGMFRSYLTFLAGPREGLETSIRDREASVAATLVASGFLEASAVEKPPSLPPE